MNPWIPTAWASPSGEAETVEWGSYIRTVYDGTTSESLKLCWKSRNQEEKGAYKKSKIFNFE